MGTVSRQRCRTFCPTVDCDQEHASKFCNNIQRINGILATLHVLGQLNKHWSLAQYFFFGRPRRFEAMSTLGSQLTSSGEECRLLQLESLRAGVRLARR